MISYVAIATNFDLNDSIVLLHSTISARLCNTRIYFDPFGILCFTVVLHFHTTKGDWKFCFLLVLVTCTAKVMNQSEFETPARVKDNEYYLFVTRRNKLGNCSRLPVVCLPSPWQTISDPKKPWGTKLYPEENIMETGEPPGIQWRPLTTERSAKRARLMDVYTL